MEQRPDAGPDLHHLSADSGLDPHQLPGDRAAGPGDHRPAIVGRVTHTDGSPAERATLTLATLQGGQVDRVHADEDGGYRLLPPTGGSYIVICVAGDTQPKAALVAVADQAVRHDIALAGASAIRGTIGIGGTGQAAVGVVVTVTDASGMVVAAVTTDHSGRYAVEDLTEGAYTLTAASVEYQPVAATVAVPSGGHVDKDIALAGRCRLTGTVRTSASGTPVDEALVTLIDALGQVVGTAATTLDGGYTFDDLPEGGYTLTAAGYAPVATAVQLAAGAANQQDVTLTSPQTHD